MARINNLSDFLSDVADAIREKKGTSDTIQASDFDTEIKNLPSGGADLSEYFNNTITENTNVSTQPELIKKIPDLVVSDNVTKLDYAFKSYPLKVIPKVICNSNVTSMLRMYNEVNKVTSIDCTGLDTSNVTTMQGMFETTNTNLLASIFFGEKFDTSNVTNMQSMFSFERILTSLDLSNFNTSKVTKMASMFSSCSSLQHLDIRNFVFDNVTSYSGMFTGVPVDCEIIVKSQTEKDWVLTQRSDFTNVKTVAEYEAEQNS